MGLVHAGYDSESSVSSPPSDDRLTKSHYKKKRKLRYQSGPWGSWSDSSDDNERESVESSNIEKSDSDDEEDRTYTEATTLESSKFYTDRRRILTPPHDNAYSFDVKSSISKCYLPKKIVHTYKSDPRGTTAIEVLPNTGHLFLSGGTQGAIKLWSLYNERACNSEYIGHQLPIKALSFDSCGKQFLSSSFDHTVRLWETETGDIKRKFTFGKVIPNTLQFRPQNDNEFIVGLSNSKIQHYDLRLSDRDSIVQTYDYHQGSILALKYFGDGSKFISSSDDKTMKIWSNQVNVPVKHISEIAQHSMPYIDTHPMQQYFCSQSMDNAIYAYSMKPKYRMHGKTAFKGHSSAGYGIGITFSPDGKYICSGDSNSKVFIWDWQTKDLLKTLKVPGKQPVTRISWLPKETSKLLCAGPTGHIYLYD